MKKFAILILAFLSLLLFAGLLPGCGGGGSHQIVYVIAAGTPAVGTFDLGGGGALTINSASYATGADPQSIVMDSQRRYVYVLNNAGAGVKGGVLQYSITSQKTGALAVVQATNNPSQILQNVVPAPTGIQPLAMAIDQKNAFVFVANSYCATGSGIDATNCSSISVFALDPTYGDLNEVSGSPFPTASTPVSIAVQGSNVFVANKGMQEVSAYTFNSSGALTALGTPVTVGSNPTAIASDGKNVYVADGTADNITVLSIGSGGLSASTTTVATGTAPVNLFVTPDGKYLYAANSGSSNISAFTLSGGIAAVGGSPYAAGTSPVFITSNLGGNLLFVANSGSGNVSSFQIGSDGTLKAASGSPYAASGFAAPNGLQSLQ